MNPARASHSRLLQPTQDNRHRCRRGTNGAKLPSTGFGRRGRGRGHHREGEKLLLERLGRGLVTHFRSRRGAGCRGGECGAAGGGAVPWARGSGRLRDAPAPGLQLGLPRRVEGAGRRSRLDSHSGLGGPVRPARGKQSLCCCHRHEAPNTSLGEDATGLLER